MERAISKPASEWKAHKFICILVLVVELADTTDLGSVEEIHAGSNPVRDIQLSKITNFKMLGNSGDYRVHTPIFGSSPKCQAFWTISSVG